ncbi:MAG: hypothetical protein KDD18_05570, partial [Mangrovimonas sp.]|nr:hypothetical protein [Mangrovimonas sp.]
TRSDYNVTIRTNRHEIVSNGWIHDQDNDKVIREEGKQDVLLAQEKGYNTYVKVANSKCKAAQDYWAKDHDKWALVRAKWDEVLARDKDLSLEDKVEHKQLFKYLSPDNQEYSTKASIDSIIEAFVK